MEDGEEEDTEAGEQEEERQQEVKLKEGGIKKEREDIASKEDGKQDKSAKEKEQERDFASKA